MKFLIFLSLLTLTSCKNDHEKKINEFYQKHGKKFNDPAKLAKSREHLIKSIERVEANNAAFLRGEVDYEMDLYNYSDENPDEILSQKCGTQRPPSARALTGVPSFPTGPAAKDWKPFLLPVVDQGVVWLI